MPALEINGTTMAFDEAGGGRPLLLIHAGIADRRMWRDVMPALARQFRVIAPDLRAYGDTPIPPAPFSWTADLLALLDALDVDRAHVMGVSMGGQVALDLALARPDRVDHLVLVGAGISGWEHRPEMAVINDAEIAAVRAGDLDTAAWGAVRAWVDGPRRGPDAVDPELRRRVFEMQRHAYEIDNEEAELSFQVERHREHLGEIAAPTLVLAGELDQEDILDMAPVLAGEIPGARYQVLPGVAHLPPMEEPDAFACAVLDFLPS